MKKNQVDEILINQTKRRNTVLSFISLIILVSIFAFAFFLIYANKTKIEYVKYNESSNIDYNVFLKENDFFEGNYIIKDKEYIASLIKYIEASFKYELELEKENIEYKYSYRIDANVNVVRKSNGKSIYSKTETLLDETFENTNDKSIVIKEKVNIDYNKYNDLIKKFNATYSLNDIESTLTVNMYVNVIGTCEEFSENPNKESVMTLSIPLATKTVGIDLSNNLINSTNNVMKCEKSGSGIIFAIIGIIFSIVDIVLIVITIRYEIKTRTAEDIYEKELKKILNNYGPYIQKMNNEFKFKGFDLIKIDTFTDMLEIRDTIRQPILMKENEQRTGAYFIIPSNTKVLYVYRLNVNDIAKGIKKEEI